MSQINQLYFLLRLQISAVVTVLPLYIFMLYTGAVLPFTIIWEELLQYLCVILTCRKREWCGVMELCLIMQYCVVSKHKILLCDDSIEHGNLCACWFSFCLLLIFCLCLWPFIYFSAVATVVWTHGMEISSCFLKFQGCDMFSPILDTLSSISQNGCMFLFPAGGAVQNSPLHCRPYFIYRWWRRKSTHNLSIHKNYVICQKHIKSFSLYAIIWYCTEVYI